MHFSPKHLSTSLYCKSPEIVQKGIVRVCSYLPYRIKFGKGCVYIGKLLKTTRGLNREQIEEFQFNRFLEIYKHAITNIPFYKEFYGEHGLNENSIRSTEDIAKIPTLSKDMVRKHLEELVWPSFLRKKIFKSTTGGTTGEPLSLYLTEFIRQMQRAFNHDIWGRVGYKPSDFRIGFSRIAYLKARSGVFQFLHPKRNILCLSIDYLNKETLKKYIEIFHKTKPKFILGHVGTIFSFTQLICEQKESIPKLKGIFLHSQKLFPGQRELMEHVLGGKVFTHYSLAEKVILAAECEYSHDYHIVPEFGYTEILNSQGQVIKSPDVVGELVGTGFHNRIMPLIRYRTGDLAAYRAEQTCECGRPHDILSHLIGRTQDFLVLKDGTLKGIAAGAHAFFIFADYCRGFQLYQEVPGKIEIRIIPKSDNPPDYLEIIRQELKNEYFGPLDFEIVVTNSLERSKSGKQKYLIQKLKTLSSYEEIVT